MRKIIPVLFLIVMLAVAGCGTDPATLPQKEPGLLRDLDTGKVYLFEDEDFDHAISYEDGSLKVSSIKFTEVKNDAYYTVAASVLLDLTNLSEDERQWFEDGYGGMLDDITASLRAYFDEDYKSMYEYSAAQIDSDGVPSFAIIYYQKEVKHSVEGEKYHFSLKIKRDDKKTDEYQYEGTIELVESENE